MDPELLTSSPVLRQGLQGRGSPPPWEESEGTRDAGQPAGHAAHCGRSSRIHAAATQLPWPARPGSPNAADSHRTSEEQEAPEASLQGGSPRAPSWTPRSSEQRRPAQGSGQSLGVRCRGPAAGPEPAQSSRSPDFPRGPTSELPSRTQRARWREVGSSPLLPRPQPRLTCHCSSRPCAEVITPHPGAPPQPAACLGPPSPQGLQTLRVKGISQLTKCVWRVHINNETLQWKQSPGGAQQSSESSSLPRARLPPMALTSPDAETGLLSARAAGSVRPGSGGPFPRMVTKTYLAWSWERGARSIPGAPRASFARPRRPLRGETPGPWWSGRLTPSITPSLRPATSFMKRGRWPLGHWPRSQSERAQVCKVRPVPPPGGARPDQMCRRLSPAASPVGSPLGIPCVPRMCTSAPAGGHAALDTRRAAPG